MVFSIKINFSMVTSDFPIKYELVQLRLHAYLGKCHRFIHSRCKISVPKRLNLTNDRIQIKFLLIYASQPELSSVSLGFNYVFKTKVLC